jgi:NitT/TauT family transport system substrate-binding protein
MESNKMELMIVGVRKIILPILCLIVFVSISVLGCGKPSATTDDQKSLKVGALSMMTVLPLYAAQQDGIFKEQGVNVEIVPFRSQIERDTALNAGQIDCIIEDIFSAPILDKDTMIVKIVAVSPVKGYMFAVIASKQSKINSPSDLKNVPIASSLGNIIEYATDQMCLAGGLQAGDIQKTSVPSMPLRLEMMNQGKIEVATFSRPLSDMALIGGGKVVCDDSQETLLTSCIMVSAAALDSRSSDVKKFVKGWASAAEKISADPDKYRSLLVSFASISPDIADTIEVPSFDQPRLPTQDEYQAKMEWNLQKNNINHIILYDDIVAKGYLPK